MTVGIPRYVIESHGPDAEAIKTAFQGAFQICVQNGISEITLLVPSKGSFPSTVVGTFLGASASKALCEGQRIKITDNLLMNLESSKTFETYRSYGMLVGLYLSQKDINVLDSASAKAIVLLPWTADEGKSWISTWNPTVLGENTWQVSQATLDPAVEGELLSLTNSINLMTGLSHPSDKKHAQEVLRKLKSSGHSPEPEDIRKWAVRNNWQPDDADDLKKLAERHFKK